MLKQKKKLKVFINPDDIYEYFCEYEEHLKDEMEIIAETDVDFSERSFLFITNENGVIFLSLEAPGVIVDSAECTKDNVTQKVNEFLEMLTMY